MVLRSVDIIWNAGPLKRWSSGTAGSVRLLPSAGLRSCRGLGQQAERGPKVEAGCSGIGCSGIGCRGLGCSGIGCSGNRGAGLTLLRREPRGERGAFVGVTRAPRRRSREQLGPCRRARFRSSRFATSRADRTDGSAWRALAGRSVERRGLSWEPPWTPTRQTTKKVGLKPTP